MFWFTDTVDSHSQEEKNLWSYSIWDVVYVTEEYQGTKNCPLENPCWNAFSLNSTQLPDEMEPNTKKSI